MSLKRLSIDRKSPVHVVDKEDQERIDARMRMEIEEVKARTKREDQKLSNARRKADLAEQRATRLQIEHEKLAAKLKGLELEAQALKDLENAKNELYTTNSNLRILVEKLSMEND